MPLFLLYFINAGFGEHIRDFLKKTCEKYSILLELILITIFLR